jgi:hypothetical protein
MMYDKKRKRRGREEGLYLRGIKFVFSNDFDGDELTGISILCFINSRKCTTVVSKLRGSEILSHFIEEFKSF